MCVPAIGRGAMERASLGALQLTLACLIAASPSAFGDRRAELWAAPPREAGDEPSEAAGWSFEALVRPSIPDASHAARVRQPIDAFVFRKLEKRGLEPAPEASPRVLLRRLWFDLAGLPPSEEELERFVRDPTEAAYERTVDLLLASPRFGERFARHWLDVARFAETSGYERDQTKTFAWRYRDWVVRAFNEDLPFEDFVSEQLAGDEVEGRDESTLIATGFLRLGTWNDEPNDPDAYRYERLDDLVHATSTAFLGLTVRCARCHDHKFDPIPQRDYYRIAAAFWGGPLAPRDAALLGGPSAAELGAEEVLGWTDLARDPPPLHVLKGGEPTQPGPVVEPGFLSLVPALDRPVPPPPAESRTTGRRLALARWIVSPANPLAARVFVNRLWLWLLGEGIVRTPNDFGAKGSPPTHPELLDWLAVEFLESGGSAKTIVRSIVLSSVYRQASARPDFAAYETIDAANTLCWRANRRRLDAEALRDSLFSASGEIDLRLGGPSFHPYASPEALEGLSRKAGAWEVSAASERKRRSIYMFTRRSLILPLFTTFDFCDTASPCGQRNVTTVPTQALALLNNSLVYERSEALADLVLRELSGAELPSCVAAIWNRALGREPEPSELRRSIEHVREQEDRFRRELTGRKENDLRKLALASLAHVLFNTNEFVYVD